MGRITLKLNPYMYLQYSKLLSDFMFAYWYKVLDGFGFKYKQIFIEHTDFQ